MTLSEGKIEKPWRGGDLTSSFSSSLSEQDINTLIPGQRLTLGLNHCLTGLVYGDGTAAENEIFFYSVDFDFATKADSEAFLKHPQKEEIISTMESFLRENPEVTESFELELDRDRMPLYKDAGEAGYNSLTSGTVGDIQVTVDEMVTIINGTYGTEIQKGTVSSSSDQVIGCSPDPSTIPENLAAAEGKHSVVATSLPIAGLK